MVEQLRLEHDARLLVGKAGAEVHPEAGKSTVEIRHGLPDVRDGPDVRVVVDKFDIMGKLGRLECLGNLVELPLKVEASGADRSLLPQPFLCPSHGLCV